MIWPTYDILRYLKYELSLMSQTVSEAIHDIIFNSFSYKLINTVIVQ